MTDAVVQAVMMNLVPNDGLSTGVCRRLRPVAEEQMDRAAHHRLSVLGDGVKGGTHGGVAQAPAVRVRRSDLHSAHAWEPGAHL